MHRLLLLTVIVCLWLPLGGRAAPTIVVLGDSLSAAYGIAQNQGWVELLQQRITANGGHARVVNASISGETSWGGRNRIEALLQAHRPSVLIVELGGNDGLRGLPVSAMRDNLDHIIRRAKTRETKVVLLGMRLPPNYGPAYTRDFHNTYTELAAQHGIALVPFMLEGFAEDSRAFQADGIHPTAAVQPRILNNVWPVLQPLLHPTHKAQLAP